MTLTEHRLAAEMRYRSEALLIVNQLQKMRLTCAQWQEMGSDHWREVARAAGVKGTPSVLVQAQVEQIMQETPKGKIQ